jgi:Zonular occludens toxin (Zot).
MMIGIIGSIDEYHSYTIRGNGKTATMTYLLYNYYFRQGCKAYTNYFTSFSTILRTEDLANNLFENDDTLDEIVRKGKRDEVERDNEIKAIGIDEIQVFYDSYGRVSKKSKLFLNISLIQQSRKKNVDIFFTIQRLRDLEKRIRSQVDLYLIPTKYHKDGKICSIDRCNEEHYIVVHRIDGKRLFWFNIRDVSDLYDQLSVVV